MKVKPLADRILVRRVAAEQKKGSIIIPDTAQEKPQEAEVVSVGDGARDDAGKLVPLTVKKGDRVLFAKWGGTEITVNDEELLIMKESDVLAIVEG